MKEINEMIEQLKAMGISEEEIKELWSIALETADKIIKEA